MNTTTNIQSNNYSHISNPIRNDSTIILAEDPDYYIVKPAQDIDTQQRMNQILLGEIIVESPHPVFKQLKAKIKVSFSGKDSLVEFLCGYFDTIKPDVVRAVFVGSGAIMLKYPFQPGFNDYHLRFEGTPDIDGVELERGCVSLLRKKLSIG